MANLEHYLDPIFRPPLSLAIVAASFKYLATLAVLGEPLLLTRGDLIGYRQAVGSGASARRIARLFGRLLFAFLATYNLVVDMRTLSKGFAEMTAMQRINFTVVVLVFSPNTVAASVGIFAPLVQMSWRVSLPAHSSKLEQVSDAISFAYAFLTGVVYLLPFMVIMTPYVVAGGFALVWVILCDTVQMPIALIRGDTSGPEWVALPVLFSFFLSHIIVAGLVAAQVLLFERRYPDLARQYEVDGTRAIAREAMKLTKIPKNVIGAARDIAANQHQQDRSLELMEGAQEDLLKKPTAALPPRSGANHNPESDRCILNDEVLAGIFYFKVTTCITMPVFQVSVAIAARIFLGGNLLHAASTTIGERSMSHYLEHLHNSGTHGTLMALWFYL